MKVRLKVSRAGDRFSQVPGDIIEVDPDEARRLLDAGHAEPVNGEARELASVVSQETAARPAGRRRTKASK